jgi:hypothetical protein
MLPFGAGGMYSMSAASSTLVPEISLTGEILSPREDFLECRRCVGLVNGGDHVSAPCPLLNSLIVDGGAWKGVCLVFKSFPPRIRRGAKYHQYINI